MSAQRSQIAYTTQARPVGVCRLTRGRLVVTHTLLATRRFRRREPVVGHIAWRPLVCLVVFARVAAPRKNAECIPTKLLSKLTDKATIDAFVEAMPGGFETLNTTTAEAIKAAAAVIAEHFLLNYQTHIPAYTLPSHRRRRPRYIGCGEDVVL